MTVQHPDKLLVVWTTADREVALNMVLMYTYNAKVNHWWHQVTLLVWGPSQKLLLTDAEVIDRIAQMKQAGVRLIACKACADNYGITDSLTRLGVEVYGTGPTLTDWLKSDCRVITF
jgi:hypothetical protein